MEEDGYKSKKKRKKVVKGHELENSYFRSVTNSHKTGRERSTTPKQRVHCE